MEIKLSGITVGNGQYDATFEVSDSQQAALVKQGLLRILQGKPSGQAEKAMAYPGKGEKRPEKFNRKSIPFGPEFIKEFTGAYEGAEVEIETGEVDKDGEPVTKAEKLNLVDIDWKEYTGASAPEPKFKRAKDELACYLVDGKGEARLLKSGEPRTAASYSASRGLPMPTEPWEEDTEWLKAVTDYLKTRPVED